jgi:hypothetical protein
MGNHPNSFGNHCSLVYCISELDQFGRSYTFLCLVYGCCFIRCYDPKKCVTFSWPEESSQILRWTDLSETNRFGATQLSDACICEFVSRLRRRSLNKAERQQIDAASHGMVREPPRLSPSESMSAPRRMLLLRYYNHYYDIIPLLRWLSHNKIPLTRYIIKAHHINHIMFLDRLFHRTAWPARRLWNVWKTLQRWGTERWWFRCHQRLGSS